MKPQVGESWVPLKSSLNREAFFKYFGKLYLYVYSPLYPPHLEPDEVFTCNRIVFLRAGCASICDGRGGTATQILDTYVNYTV